MGFYFLKGEIKHAKKNTNNLFKKIIDSSINKPEVSEQSQWDSWMNQTEAKKDNWYKSVKEKFEQNIKNWVKIKKISEEFSLFLNELFDKNKNIEKDLNLECIRIEEIRNLLAKSGHLNSILAIKTVHDNYEDEYPP